MDREIDQFHEQQYQKLQEERESYSFGLIILWEKNIPAKKAGVGYARKVGMEEATQQLEKGHLPIVNLDADCQVDPDYCRAWHHLFEQENLDAATMHFEHPFTQLNEAERRAIIEYELHLRYYFRAQEFIGYPNAIQPIGSCMGVRKDFYQKIGGMNSRKAGEDFYFLQKCVLNGKWVYDKSTTIYPQARISDRVPFGTGKAMRDLLTSAESYQTYNWQSFLCIKIFIEALNEFANDPDLSIWKYIPDEMHDFLEEEQLDYNLKESVQHTGSPNALRKRLFRWYHPFRLMKTLHYLRDQHYPDKKVLGQANQLMDVQFEKQFEEEEDLLLFMRESY
jgi:glycosyltransferase involved in cell wall biosynthesis